MLIVISICCLFGLMFIGDVVNLEKFNKVILWIIN